MLLKIHTGNEGNVYRFDYDGWDIIVTISSEKSELHGIAICKINNNAPVYTAKTESIFPSQMHSYIANTVGELARQIAVNFAHNCLDDI